MVLCQDLLYNTPCTITFDAINGSSAWSLPTLDTLLETTKDAKANVGECVAYSLYYWICLGDALKSECPHFWKILDSVWSKCTIAIGGTETTGEELLAEYGGYEVDGVSLVIYVLAGWNGACTISVPKCGISRDDLWKCEEFTGGIFDNGADEILTVIWFGILLGCGFLNPVETYCNLAVALALAS